MEKDKTLYKGIAGHIWSLIIIGCFIYFGVDRLTREGADQYDGLIGGLDFLIAFIVSYSYLRPMVKYLIKYFKGE